MIRLGLIIILMSVFTAAQGEELPADVAKIAPDHVTMVKGDGTCEKPDFEQCEILGLPICLPSSLVCNGLPDCDQGTDETNCTTCTDPALPCMHQPGKCIQSDWLCDGVKDCQDGSDELQEYCLNNGNNESFGLVVNKKENEECSNSMLCPQKCANLKGATRCECHQGYTFKRNEALLSYCSKDSSSNTSLLLVVQGKTLEVQLSPNYKVHAPSTEQRFGRPGLPISLKYTPLYFGYERLSGNLYYGNLHTITMCKYKLLSSDHYCVDVINFEEEQITDFKMDSENQLIFVATIKALGFHRVEGTIWKLSTGGKVLLRQKIDNRAISDTYFPITLDTVNKRVFYSYIARGFTIRSSSIHTMNYNGEYWKGFSIADADAVQASNMVVDSHTGLLYRMTIQKGSTNVKVAEMNPTWGTTRMIDVPDLNVEATEDQALSSTHVLNFSLYLDHFQPEPSVNSVDSPCILDQCHHLCVNDRSAPDGIVCLCTEGFELMPDGRQCMLVEEIETTVSDPEFTALSRISNNLFLLCIVILWAITSLMIVASYYILNGTASVTVYNYYRAITNRI